MPQRFDRADSVRVAEMAWGAAWVLVKALPSAWVMLLASMSMLVSSLLLA
jgi:hypothetical protein